MRAEKGLVGRKFGRWTILGTKTKYTTRDDGTKSPHGKLYATCSCSCGTIADVVVQNLRRGVTLSCGCLRTTLKKETKGPQSKEVMAKVKKEKDMTTKTAAKKNTGEVTGPWWHAASAADIRRRYGYNKTNGDAEHGKPHPLIEKAAIANGLPVHGWLPMSHINTFYVVSDDSVIVDVNGIKFAHPDNLSPRVMVPSLSTMDRKHCLIVAIHHCIYTTDGTAAVARLNRNTIKNICMERVRPRLDDTVIAKLRQDILNASGNIMVFAAAIIDKFPSREPLLEHLGITGKSLYLLIRDNKVTDQHIERVLSYDGQ